jgi:GTP cyclohydrolase II
MNVEKAVNRRVKRSVSARTPTGLRDFELCLCTDQKAEKEQFALITGNVRGKSNILVRIQSECFSGEVLGSYRCVNVKQRLPLHPTVNESNFRYLLTKALRTNHKLNVGATSQHREGGGMAFG